MKKVFYLILVLFLASSATATTISSQNVTIDLETSQVEVDMEVAELTSSALTYITSYPVENVEVEANDRELDCEVTSLQIGSEISCDTDLRHNFDVHMEFRSTGLVSSRNNARIFSYSHSIYRPTDNYRLRIALPSGGALIDQKNASTPVVSPQGYTTESNGQRIFVEWNRKPRIGETLRFTAMYQEYSSTFNYVKIVALPALLLIIAVVGYITWKRKNRDSIEVVYGELSEDEIEIIELLRENDGEMLQKDVVDSSDYSKAKISGLVSGLVDREIIDKKKEGRSNKLSISSNFAH